MNYRNTDTHEMRYFITRKPCQDCADKDAKIARLTKLTRIMAWEWMTGIEEQYIDDAQRRGEGLRPYPRKEDVMEKGTDVAGINDELVDAYHALQEDFAKSQAEITRLNAVIQSMATDLVECGYCADIEAAPECDGRETGN